MPRRLRLTKKTAILFGAVIVILSGALGYLLWRVNQTDTTAPTDSSASCPDGCFPHDGFDICTGVGGCKGNGTSTSCSSGWELHQGFCCEKCTSTAAPVKCEFYPNGVTAEKPYNNQTVFPAGYYKCDSAGYCIPCTPVSSETIPSIDDCIEERRAANGSLEDNCPEGQYKWSCQQLDDGSGYVLEQIPCVDTSGPTEPTLNCGENLEPTTYSYNKVPTSQIGPFPKDGYVVLLYKSLNDAGYRPRLVFKDPDGTNHTYKISPLDSNNRAKVTTDTAGNRIEVKAGDYITLVSSNDDRTQTAECAPEKDNTLSFGWIAPSAGQCGSGLGGPPSGPDQTQTPMAKKSITADVTWAQGLGYDIVDNKGQQCWADWREWPGDYDFEDYFLMVSYDTAEIPIIETANISIAKTVSERCIDERTENPISELTYTITVVNSGNADGEVNDIEDILDEKVVDTFVQADSITGGGVYEDGKITWDFTDTKLSVPAGESKAYSYKLLIDKDNFGTYTNAVYLQEPMLPCPEGTSCPAVMPALISAEAEITADCIINNNPVIVTPGGESVPQTGLFDTTISKVIAGFVLVVFGGIVYNIPNITKDNFKYREKFEKKVANR